MSANYGNKYLFKLRREFWSKSNQIYKEIEIEGGEVLSITDLKEINNDEDIDKWFDPMPLSTLFEIRNYEGAYVIFHRFKSNEEEE